MGNWPPIGTPGSGARWIRCAISANSRCCGTRETHPGSSGEAVSDTPASGLSATQQWLDRQLLRVLPAKLHQLTRFGVAGILATLLYFVLTNGIVIFGGVDPVAASIYGYLLSLIFSYLMQSRFAFRVTGDRPGQVLGFVVTSLAGLAI